jgi:hypothetical protein
MRPYKRRNKRCEPLPDEEYDNDDDDDEEEYEEFPDDAKQQQAPPLKKYKKDWKTKDLAPMRETIRCSEAEYEANIAFCCKICNCPTEEKEAFAAAAGDDSLVQTTEDYLWHRRCCHRKGMPDNPDDKWMDPFQKANDIIHVHHGADNSHGKFKAKESVCIEVGKGEIEQKYNVANNQLSELYNEDELEGRALPEACYFLFATAKRSHNRFPPDHSTRLLSNKPYQRNLKSFAKLQSKRSGNLARYRATVLVCKATYAKLQINLIPH